jgi:DNA primase
MRYSDAFLRTLKDRASISAYAGTKLAFDKRKSQPQRGDYWACCPFHGEKSPSFHVIEDKGTFKCFGCGEAGGTLDLVMKFEGLTFPEAVERLADFAGVPLPEDEKDDRSEVEARKRSRALAAAAAAAGLFAEGLKSAAGAEARTYLIGRGVGPELWERFGIGFALDSWTLLIDALGRQGFSLDELVAAGLARPPQDGKRAIDFFRGRLMFRIDDAQGRPIAFGGRSLQKDAPAKYINSPDCLIFHKGQTLYRLKSARETLARSKAEGLIVAEGYLDVIALERAGLPGVAPLGTALTPEQLALLWKAGPEPTLCFDGDLAGQRAAAKVLAMALAQVGPEKTIRLVLVPGSEDPDDVFRRAGAEGLKALLASAKPAVEALFEQEVSAKPLTTPEAKAGLKARLKKAAFLIQDEDTRGLYLRELLAKADGVLRPAAASGTAPPGAARAPFVAKGKPKGGKGFGGFRELPAQGPTAALKASLGGRTQHDIALMLGAAIDHAALAADHAEDLACLLIEDRGLSLIRDTLLTLCAEGQACDRECLINALNDIGAVDVAARVPHLPVMALEQKGSQDDQAEAVRMSLAAEEVQPPELIKAPGATRARVARRAQVRLSVRDRSQPPLSASARAEFARLLRETVGGGTRAQEQDLLLAESDDDLIARAQAMTFDKLRAARAAREATLDGADD